MDVLFDSWKYAWEQYEIGSTTVFIAFLIIAALAYRDWSKTLLGVWGVVYLWTMTVLLTDTALELGEGFVIVWVCGYGLLGFFALGFLFYYSLKS
jgi:hypothetical protein